MRFPAVLILLAATLTACGGSSDSTGASDTYSGTYTLRTVNGQSLPFLHDQVETTTIEVVSDTLVVADDGNGGSFTKQMEIRVTASGVARSQPPLRRGGLHAQRDRGDLPVQPSKLGMPLLQRLGRPTAVGTISGGKITFSDGAGVSYVYQK
jgi:hypothetical protein